MTVYILQPECQYAYKEKDQYSTRTLGTLMSPKRNDEKYGSNQSFVPF